MCWLRPHISALYVMDSTTQLSSRYDVILPPLSHTWQGTSRVFARTITYRSGREPVVHLRTFGDINLHMHLATCARQSQGPTRADLLHTAMGKTPIELTSPYEEHVTILNSNETYTKFRDRNSDSFWFGKDKTQLWRPRTWISDEALSYL